MLEKMMGTFNGMSFHMFDGLGYKDFSLLIGFGFWMLGLFVSIKKIDKNDHVTEWLYVTFFILSAVIQMIALPQEYQKNLQSSNLMLALIAIGLITWGRWFKAKKYAFVRIRKNGQKK